MINRNKLKYYNNFLILSILLIVGYFSVSMYLLNRTWKSGNQVEEYGKTIERTNSIIQNTTELENSVYRYLLTQAPKEELIYETNKITLLENVDKLVNHCTSYHFAKEETEKLSALVSDRVDELEKIVQSSQEEGVFSFELVKEDLSNQEMIQVLQAIRQANKDKQSTNQEVAVGANRNLLVLLAVFGMVMMLIVFYSFFKMRQELSRSRRLLMEIRKVNSELNSVNEHLENFAYVASHDLHEPLRKINVFGEFIKEELLKDEINKELAISHVERMQDASSRMQSLMQNLLSYAKIDKDFKMDESVDLNKVVNVVLSDVQVMIEEKNAKVKVGDLPKDILADPIQMHQLFQNLICNGIKFNKPGVAPVVELSSDIVQKTSLPIINGLNKEASQYYKISVSDNGIGFDKKYKEQIFEFLQRLDGRSKSSGTGIGLSICKRICENHQGFITAESEEGEGAVFHVYLPKIN